LSSFGLSQADRPTLHENIFQLCYHSQGAFTHGDVYSMPIFLRNFYTQQLIAAKKKGYDSCILYLIQRNDCKKFKIASDIDEKYNLLFQKAIKSKIKILCYDCKITNKEITLNNQIKYES